MTEADHVYEGLILAACDDGSDTDVGRVSDAWLADYFDKSQGMFLDAQNFMLDLLESEQVPRRFQKRARQWLQWYADMEEDVFDGEVD